MFPIHMLDDVTYRTRTKW